MIGTEEGRDLSGGAVRGHRLPRLRPAPPARAAQSIWAFLTTSLRDARHILLAMWAVFIILFPFYPFDSGMPQPADVVMAALIGIVMLGSRARPPAKTIPAIRMLLAFVAYVCLTNLVWSIAENSYSLSTRTGFLFHPIYYIYNALIFITGLRLYGAYGERFIRVSALAILVCLAVQIGGSILYVVRPVGRPVLFFNNPNQLGYFGLLAGSVFAFTLLRLPQNRYLAGATFACCAYLALISASKAAVLGLGALAVVSLLTRPTTLLLGALALGSVAFYYRPASDMMEQSVSRVSQLGGDASDSLEGRGYGRIRDNPKHLVLGAGEGMYARFPSAIGSHEIHSSIGTLLFSYGLFGTILFGGFVVRVLRGHGLKGVITLLPTGLYGLTHQGLRFSMFWVLLVMVSATSAAATPAARARD